MVTGHATVDIEGDAYFFNNSATGARNGGGREFGEFQRTFSITGV